MSSAVKGLINVGFHRTPLQNAPDDQDPSRSEAHRLRRGT